MNTSDEVFDVVNEHNEVIGQAARSQIHRLGLRHRSVHVLVFNARGQLFLQKRSRRKDTHPGAWDSSASGHVAAGEGYDACALRELEEELGIRPEQPPQVLFGLEACPETGQEFVRVYGLRHEGPFVLHAEEIEGGEWFDVGRLEAWLASPPEPFASSFPLIWRRLRAYSSTCTSVPPTKPGTS